MEGRCTTITNLKPDTQNWFVKALIVEKTPVRYLKWGKQQRLVLADKENERMQCIIYEQDVDRLDEVLQLYGTYFIGNGKIKETTASTPILGSSKYQITLSRSTYIKPTTKHEELPLDHVYQLTPFTDFPQFADSTNTHINLLCSVIHVFPPRFIQKISKNVQEFVIVNEESRPTILTLWEEFMQSEGLHLSEIVHEKPIILGMRLSVTNYHGISIGTLLASTLLFNPPIPQAKRLESWLKMNTAYVDKIVPEKLYKKENQTTDKPLDSQIRKLSQILSLTETVKSFWTKSMLQVTKPGQNFYFLGCPGCSKACGAIYGSDFTCFYCNNQFSSPKPVLRFEAELYDGTGCLDVFVEHAEAEMLLRMSGEDIVKAQTEGNMLNLDDINDSFKNMLFFFHVRTSNTELRGRKFTRNTVMTCLPASDQPTPSHKRAISAASMSESQQSTSTLQEEFAPPNVPEHQQVSVGKKNLKHAKQH